VLSIVWRSATGRDGLPSKIADAFIESDGPIAAIDAAIESPDVKKIEKSWSRIVKMDISRDAPGWNTIAAKDNTLVQQFLALEEEGAANVQGVAALRKSSIRHYTYFMMVYTSV
jgi:hypothetical protein